MPSVPKKLKSPFVPHLSDLQLVAYQDGEMRRAELEAARTHVESCWICRSRLGAVQDEIDRFLEVRKSLLPEPPAFSETRVEQFRQRLLRHAEQGETSRVSAAGRALERFRAAVGEHRKAVIASALAACLLVAMFSDVLNTRVSADTVLARTENYETQHHPARGQVSKVSIRVEKIDRHGSASPLGTIVVVHDSETPATYWQAQSRSGSFENTASHDTPITASVLRAVLPGDAEDAALIEYLDQQRWLPDFAVDGMRRLVSSRGSTEAAVKRSGDALEVVYPFAPGHASGISQARLLVSARDYAPISLSLVRSAESAAQEYRFTRTSLTAEPRGLELAHLILQRGTSLSPTHSVSEPGRAAARFRRALPLTYANSHASLEEVEAAQALHRVDSCLGEEIYLFPMSDGSLLVQGLVDSGSRRDVIRQSLRAVSGPLQIEVFVPRELKNGSELYAPPDRIVEGGDAADSAAVSSSTTLADLSSASMPLHDRIYKHLSKAGVPADVTEKEVAIFSNEIVTHARQTFLHAWALKKLDREFSAERTAGLPASALREVERMREDHRRWIANLAARQTEMLSAIADLPAAANMTDAARAGSDGDTLLRLAREQNDLVRSLFTASHGHPEASESLTRLILVLRRMGS